MERQRTTIETSDSQTWLEQTIEEIDRLLAEPPADFYEKDRREIERTREVFHRKLQAIEQQ